MAKITVLILAFNEQIHIERCIKSAKQISDSVYVVDSFSSDDTVKIAESCGANVLRRKFDSHAAQFNWGLNEIPSCDWVVRMDADEYLTDILKSSIAEAVEKNDHAISGFSFKRRIYFMGKKIEYGGVFPVEVVRMFRFGRGLVESRLMDEHILVDGQVGTMNGELIDDNKNSLTWWIEKHNRYSSLEAFEMYLAQGPSNNENSFGAATNMRRKLKSIYLSAPIPLRALGLFVYRYFFRLGFFDGYHGFLFHFYQGFWYRFLVDCKYVSLLKTIDLGDQDLEELISCNLQVHNEIIRASILEKREN